MIRRWINEYLDGEIGLADKAELERIMQEHPEVREEYRSLRQIGLLMGNQPEVQVRPYAFRQRLAERIDADERPILTPQRAFSAAMLVALMVVGLSMGFFLMQQKELGSSQASGVARMSEATRGAGAYVSLSAPVPADRFYARLLTEYQLGLQEQSVIAPFLLQTQVFEGASCSGTSTLDDVRFASAPPKKIMLELVPGAAVKLARLATDLSGQPVILHVNGAGMEGVSFQQFIRERGSGQTITLVLVLQ